MIPTVVAPTTSAQWTHSRLRVPTVSWSTTSAAAAVASATAGAITGCSEQLHDHLHGTRVAGVHDGSLTGNSLGNRFYPVRFSLRSTTARATSVRWALFANA